MRSGPLLLGLAAGALWMTLFGLVAPNARGYAWTTFAAGLVAWLVALLLARWGDRGAAVGVTLAAGLGVAVAASVVMLRWSAGTWLLW